MSPHVVQPLTTSTQLQITVILALVLIAVGLWIDDPRAYLLGGVMGWLLRDVNDWLLSRGAK